MKKILLFSIVILLAGCSPSKNFFATGSVNLSERIQEIPITYQYNLPMCMVSIGGKTYKFMIDTGAPTVISEEIFTDLKLKSAYSEKVGDSQKKSQKQQFASVPEIQIGDLVFTNIGAVVITLQREFKCLGIDGILGANLMAKAACEFDYENGSMRLAKDLRSFQPDSSDFTFDFKPVDSKTPMVNGKILDKDYVFTFDTGYTGNLQVGNDYNHYKSKISDTLFVTSEGVSSIGVYGTNEPTKSFTVKSMLSVGGKTFSDELVDGGHLNLIGNQFLQDYIFVIDWTSNKIYFKNKENRQEKKEDGFGFAYLFIDGRAKVVRRVEDPSIPLQLGDQVLSIDDISFEGLNEYDQCKYFTDRVEGDKSEINIRIKRENSIHEFTMKRQVFLN